MANTVVANGARPGAGQLRCRDATAGAYRVEAAATGYALKGVDGVSIAAQNLTAVNFSLAP